MTIREIRLDDLSGSSFDELFQSQPELLFERVADLLLPQFTVSDLGIDHRTILHWENQEIMDVVKNQAGGWRKYSFFDYVWLQVVRELRDFGMPIPVVKAIRTQLFVSKGDKMVDDLTEEDYSQIKNKFGQLPEYLKKEMTHITPEFIQQNANQQELLILFNKVVMEVIYTRAMTWLVIQKDGKSEVVIANNEKELEKLLNEINVASSLLISISKIVDDFFSSTKFSGNTYFRLAPLTRQEMEIIDIIRSGGVNNISITLKDGKEFYVEVLRKRPARNVIDQIAGIIGKNGYRRITIDTENGKTAFIKETEKRIIR